MTTTSPGRKSEQAIAGARQEKKQDEQDQPAGAGVIGGAALGSGHAEKPREKVKKHEKTPWVASILDA
jgi:purine nucleoside phosphorylase